MVAAAGIRTLPGVMAAVERLGRASKLAVVTGASSAEARDALVGAGVARFFPVVVAAEDYKHGKPSPEPYLQAIERLGVSAASVDRHRGRDPGILSARAAGARVIAVRAGNFAGYDLSPADVVVDTLDEVTDELTARLLA